MVLLLIWFKPSGWLDTSDFNRECVFFSIGKPIFYRYIYIICHVTLFHRQVFFSGHYSHVTYLNTGICLKYIKQRFLITLQLTRGSLGWLCSRLRVCDNVIIYPTDLVTIHLIAYKSKWESGPTPFSVVSITVPCASWALLRAATWLERTLRPLAMIVWRWVCCTHLSAQLVYFSLPKHVKRSDSKKESK